MKSSQGYQKDQKNSRINKQMKRHGPSNYTKIVPIPKSYFKTNNAVLIAGFPGPGMIGSIVCNQLIEQLNLHQIAYIHSEYITPGVIWVGGRLRHPFRIYCNEHKSVCLLICDVPVVVEGIDSISESITSWCEENNVNRIFVVTGIYPDNMNPFPKNLTKRNAFVIENDAVLNSSTDSNNSRLNGKESPDFAFIGGLPGQVLANAVVRFIHCVAVLVPAFSFIPDPEGAALVIEALGNLIPNAKISSLELRQEAEKIKSQLLDLGKLQRRLMKNSRSGDTTHDDAEQIYK